MDRRDSLKSFLIGSLAAPALLNGCVPDVNQPGQDTPDVPDSGDKYGRTPDEKELDRELMSKIFFSEDEMATIAVLCDIILPASADFGSATDAEVPAFIEFMSKDLPAHQLPLRGGIMWLNNRSLRDFGKVFKDLSNEKQIAIVDEIAYPDPDAEEQNTGVLFFNRMRDLTLSGYYTTKMGIDDLGFVGNRPNVWDGVPDDVLEKHGLAYEEEMLPKYITAESRETIAQWDDDGNLIS